MRKRESTLRLGAFGSGTKAHNSLNEAEDFSAMCGWFASQENRSSTSQTVTLAVWGLGSANETSEDAWLPQRQVLVTMTEPCAPFDASRATSLS